MTQSNRDRQLHIVPVKDTGLKHTLECGCKCKPRIEDKKPPAVVTHVMVGEGKDEWRLEFVKRGVKP